MSARVHYNGRVSSGLHIVTEGAACRPDGEFSRTMLATADTSAVTCLLCKRVMR